MLKISRNGSHLVWEMKLADYQSPPISVSIENSPDHHYIWRALTKSAHPIFFHLLPVPQLHIETTKDIRDDAFLGPAVKEFVQLIQGTQDFLSELKPQFEIAKDFQNTFFYSPDDHPHLKHLYEETQRRSSHEIFYDICSTGWNPVDRVWERPTFFPLRDLIRRLIEKKVKRFVTVNHYFISHHQSHGVFVLPLFQKLGIEYIGYYGDTFEGISPIESAAYHSEFFHSYAISAHLTRDWNQIHGNANSIPHSTGYFRNKAYTIQSVDKASSILVASNSRIQDLKINFLKLLSIFESSTRDENIFDDFQIWFMAVRRVLLHHSELKGPVLESAGLGIYQYYINGISFLKFMILDGLKTSRKILLYGDKGWAKIFPEFYQNEYLNEAGYARFAEEKRAINLLMNACVFYPDANPVVHKAIDLSIPYLGMPATVRTPAFEGFRTLEYASLDELSMKLEELPKLITDSSLLSARKHFIDSVYSLQNSMIADFSGEKSWRETSTNAFSQTTQEHLQLLDVRTKDYILANQEQIRQQIYNLFYLPNFEFKFEQSRFSNRPFMQKLKRLYEL